MKILIVGLGIQGNKRLKYFSSRDIVYTFDPYNKNADFKKLSEIDLDYFESVFICTPINQKERLINYFLKKEKNILIEKPSILNIDKLKKIKTITNDKQITFYTAYNHRFEPNIMYAKKILKKNSLGKIYLINGFYGNGTAMDVRKSRWKDIKNGLLYDLSSHLFDTLIYLINIKNQKFEIFKEFKFENKYEDHLIITNKKNNLAINLETSYITWKNKFFINIYGSKGSLHLNGLCKWGESSVEIHKRIIPSGKPIIKRKIFNMLDPTWKKELNFFKKAVKFKNNYIDRDILLGSIFKNIIK